MKFALCVFALLALPHFFRAQTDSTKKAVFYIPTYEYDFGIVTQGDPMEMQMECTNTGNDVLVIFKCQTGCGCDVPKCDPNPILPGKKSLLYYKYDSNRVGPMNKTMTVTTNDPERPTVVLHFKGEVVPKKE